MGNILVRVVITICSGEIASLELKSMGGYRLLVNETGIHPQVGFPNGEHAFDISISYIPPNHKYNKIFFKLNKESNENDFLIFNLLSRQSIRRLQIICSTFIWKYSHSKMDQFKIKK